MIKTLIIYTLAMVINKNYTSNIQFISCIYTGTMHNTSVVSELAITFTFMHLAEFGAVLISYRWFRGDDVIIRVLQRSF